MCHTNRKKSNQLWHTEPQFLIKTCRKRFWWLNSVVSQDRRVIKLHPCKRTSSETFHVLSDLVTGNKTWLLKTNANLFCQIPVAQKRYTCEPIVNKMTFNWAFQRETNRQTKQHCWFLSVKCNKMYIWHGNRRKTYLIHSPLLVLCVINSIGLQNSNEVMMTQFYVNSFIAQMSKKISYFTPLWGLAYSANCNQTHVTKKQLSNMSKLTCNMLSKLSK